MEYANLKASLFKECKGFCILLLGFLIVMGLLILALAAILSLGTYIPALTPVALEGQALVTGSFTAIMTYPLIFILLLVLGGYLLQRFGWDAWF
nr:hypothetical protein [uncultured Methanoregula sp.]